MCEVWAPKTFLASSNVEALWYSWMMAFLIVWVQAYSRVPLSLWGRVSELIHDVGST